MKVTVQAGRIFLALDEDTRDDCAELVLKHEEAKADPVWGVRRVEQLRGALDSRHSEDVTAIATRLANDLAKAVMEVAKWEAAQRHARHVEQRTGTRLDLTNSPRD